MDKVFVILGAEELYTAAILKNSKDFKLYNNRAQARINLNKVSTIFWKKIWSFIPNLFPWMKLMLQYLIMYEIFIRLKFVFLQKKNSNLINLT